MNTYLDKIVEVLHAKAESLHLFFEGLKNGENYDTLPKFRLLKNLTS
jgi:hypothetical protein